VQAIEQRSTDVPPQLNARADAGSARRTEWPAALPGGSGGVARRLHAAGNAADGGWRCRQARTGRCGARPSPSAQLYGEESADGAMAGTRCAGGRGRSAGWVLVLEW
jgi:hypothetical protein